MPARACSVVLCLLAVSAAGVASGHEGASATASAAHDAAFWRDLAAHPDRRPEGASPAALLLEATTLLASPDPTLRDGVGYGLAAEWIVRSKTVDPAGLRALLTRWTANLKVGLGETGTDTVLLVGHLYFTFVYDALSGMVSGYVSESYARLEHAKWFARLPRREPYVITARKPIPPRTADERKARR